MIAAQSLPRLNFATVASAALLGVGVYHVLLTVSTVLAFGLRYPFMDQFRANLRYLTTPFPQSVLELENGHRPVLPGLVRVVELFWLGGTQVLQALTAWLAAGVAAAMLVLVIRRDLRRNPVLLASGVCVVFAMLAWNANARMFIHAFEAQHVFYVVCFLVIAIHFAARDPLETDVKSWIFSVAACIAATFSFGSGIASFAAVLVVAVLRRHTPGPLLFIALSALATFVLYFLVLPGAEGVRNSISEFAFRATVFVAIARVGAVFAELVRIFVPDLAVQAIVAVLAAAVGIAFLVLSLLRQWRRSEPFADAELFGVALFVFGFATNVLIAVSRANFFFGHPDQLFADRYLFWSCVTWLGLVIYGLQRLVQASTPWQYAAAAAIGVLSLAAVPSAIWFNQWSAEVYRASELAAVAIKLGIKNDAQIAQISDAGLATTYRALDEMHKRDLSMFANRTSLRLGDKIPLTQYPLTVLVTVVRGGAVRSTDLTVRAVSGELPRSLALQAAGAELWFADRIGALIGRAALTNTGDQPRNLLRLGVPVLVGFQGYVVQSEAPAILFAREGNGVVKQLARLEQRQSTASAIAPDMQN